ncbi:MAG: oxygen-independent coproporphyrinogen III oxidase-like protein [Thiotrichaceae bacterium]|nr:oxygen-independent coproporphyrinogen III oxidase-like protein [Thiotrichaceae bacterium]
MTPIPLSLYIHFPWCVQKCPYCDFNSHKQPDIIPEDRYIQALLRDLEQVLPSIWGRRLHTVFIGGGTPSLLSAEGLNQLIKGLQQRLPMRPSMEFTLEANPGTFEQDKFSGFYQAGVNRLSIGIQSFADQQLQKLKRVHSADEALKAIAIAKKAGFSNFNLDLMFGLSGQSIEEALGDLQQAIDCQPPHLSWYQLTIEPNTLFYNQPPSLPNHDLLADMHEQGSALLAKHGYQQYEVSAFAQPKQTSQHNKNYWQFGDYIGIGAGAHGKITQQQTISRTMRVKHPEQYMQACLSGQPDKAIATQTELAKDTLPFEFMLNALRLKEGFQPSLYTERTFLSLSSLEQGLEKADEKQLIIHNNENISLSSHGWNFLDEAVECFL